MAETDVHRDLMVDLIDTLRARFARVRRVYVSGNLLIYYVPGNKRKHLAPDVFVVRGVSKKKRLYYLVWEERKSPEMIIELTSKSTKNEDLKKKFELYEQILKVQEYFLFDPYEEYLKPSLQGYRLQHGKYVPIQPVDGRLPSEVTGLHLERDGNQLRLYDPATGKWLPTREERLQEAEEARKRAETEIQRVETEIQRAEAEIQQAKAEKQQAKAEIQQAEAEKQQAKAEKQQAEAEKQQAEAARLAAEAARLAAEAETERLRQEIDALRRKSPQNP